MMSGNVPKFADLLSYSSSLSSISVPLIPFAMAARRMRSNTSFSYFGSCIPCMKSGIRITSTFASKMRLATLAMVLSICWMASNTA